ncbi:MAG: hypothetical protein ACXVNM_06320 [Bacteroidia bacterium]
MNSKAMEYEYLIRRAHQCGRYGVGGADADDFRSLERKAAKYLEEREKSKAKGNEIKYSDKEIEALKEYMVSAGEISAYIKSATIHVRKKYEDKLSDEQSNELEEIEASLIDLDMEKIVKAIGKADAIMIAIGLMPR